MNKMPKLIEKLKNIKLAIFDLDGVVYRGNLIIKKADEVIKELKKKSIDVVYNTNNSTITREMYVQKLRKMNIPCEREDFYTSASITAFEISKIIKNAKIFVIGEIGLREELKAHGHEIIVDESHYNDVDFVIVGLDRHFYYSNLVIAQKCILYGKAKFYATNADTTLPYEDRLLPGAGVMVNAVQTCTNFKPERTFGKPQLYGIECILKDREVLPENACIFGDRLNTDILAGNRAKLLTIAVLTGVATIEEIENLKEESLRNTNIDLNFLPDLTINSLSDIFENY